MQKNQKRPRKVYKNFLKEKHLFNHDIKYNLEYNRLLREANLWNSSGQYWLGEECERLAKSLLNENTDEYGTIVKSETFFFKTKKFMK